VAGNCNYGYNCRHSEGDTMIRCLSVFLVLASFASAQTVKLPDKVDLKAYRITEPGIQVDWDGDTAVVVSGSPEIVAFREYVPDPKVFMLRVVGYTKGTYNLTVVVGKNVDGKAILVKGTMVVTVEGGAAPTPEPVPVPPDPTPADDDPVDPKDPDFPGEIDANLVRSIITAAGTYPKPELKKLAKAHVLVAGVLKNGQNTKVKQVNQLAASSMRDNVSTAIPETLASLLGGELNKVLPRDPETVMTAAQISVLRKKLLSFARALNSAGK
jgi:hypothetical protein